jgi:hypothetical protein
VAALPVVGEGGGFVAVFVALLVGSKVTVTVGVDVTVSVGAGVAVGKGEGIKGVEVGNGVNVGKLKLNKGVGVACPPAVGNRFGLGTTVAGLRDRVGSRLNNPEQMQQNISKARPGKSILPSCPCWLYAVFNVERNVLI